MSRASQPKRKQRQAVGLPPAQGRAGLRRRGLAIAAVGAAVLVAGLGVWNLYRGGEATPRAGAQIPANVRLKSALPDPDTTSMTVPVARAIREAREAALAQPDSAEAAGRLGQVYHAHWLHDAAAACYEIARRLDPEDFRWVYLLAGVEEIRGAESGRVDQLFRAAIRRAPRFAPVYVRHADALLRLGRWSEARDAYAAAVERDPELVLAHRGLGQAALLLGDGPTALEHLEQAARLEPEDRIAQVALARVYALLDRGEQAAQAARKAETLSAEAGFPDPIFFEMESLAVDPQTLRERAARSLQEGAYVAAIQALTLLEESEGAAVRKQLGLARKLRANQLAFGGDFAAALAEFQRAARLSPTDPEIEHNWGTVLLRRGNLEEAGRHFENAIELNPLSADSLYNLGVVLEGLGRTDEAIRRFSAAAAINPQHVAAGRLAELGVTSQP